MSQQTRLPSAGAQRSRTAEVLLGIGALVGIAVLVLGVPVGLWLFAGPPWSPEIDASLLTDSASARDVVMVITILLWLVWAFFCACLVLEAAAEGRGGRIAPQLLGGGAGTQGLARRLVAGVVLIGGTATASMSSAHPISVPAEETPVPTVVAQKADDGGDTSSNASQNRFVPVEQRETEGVVPYYDVRPPEGRNYETLWDIAERYLGSGLRYKEIFALNRGVAQPDGRTLSSTDLIQPGWVLRLPSDAEGPGLRIVDHSLESLEPADSAETANAAVAAVPPEEPTDSSEQEPGAVAQTTDAVAEEDGTGTPWAPLFGVAGGLVASGLAYGLRRYRESATIGSLVGRPLAPSSNETRSAEAALRDEADDGAARMLSRALRAWTADPTGVVPPIAQCSVSETSVTVSFHSAPTTAPANGWRSLRGGRIWTIGREHTETVADASISPAPGLTALGRRGDGSTLALDLDTFRGVVSIGGDPQVARAAAMSVALDVATHEWADQRQVTMVGFADDVTAVAEQTIRVVDELPRVIRTLERVAGEQRHTCARVGARSVHDARFHHPDPQLWQHHLVVCSGVPTVDSLTALAELAADVRTSIAVLVVGDVPNAAARLVAAADGRLTSAPLGIDVQAQRIDVDAYRGLVDAYQRTAADDADPEGPDEIAAAVDISETEPSLLDPSARQPVEVRLLGPVRVDGQMEISEPRRDLLTEIVAYVALQPEGVHTNTLTAAIWPRGVPDVTRDAELERVSVWLGAERFGEVDGLWRLQGPGVRVDWDVFRAYLDHAERMPREAAQAMTAALELVRGPAWAELPPGRYGWLAHEPAYTQMPALVIRTARRLSELQESSGNPDAARDALMTGLRMAPASEQLWCDALRLASHHATPRDVKLIADQMYDAIARLGSPRGAGTETDALVEQLLPGYRRAA